MSHRDDYDWDKYPDQSDARPIPDDPRDYSTDGQHGQKEVAQKQEQLHGYAAVFTAIDELAKAL